MKLGCVKNLLPQAKVIELGCGADAGCLPELAKEGKPVMGVDLDPTKDNQDQLAAESFIRMTQTSFNANLGFTRFSCYPFYPDQFYNGKKTVKDVLAFLRKKTGRFKSDGVDAMHQMLQEGSAYDIPMVLGNDPREVLELFSQVVKANALDVVQAADDQQFDLIWADYVFNNDSAYGLSLAELCRKKMSEEGRLVLLQEVSFMYQSLGQILKEGFEVEKEEAITADSPMISLARKAKMLADPDEKCRRVWLKKVA